MKSAARRNQIVTFESPANRGGYPNGVARRHYWPAIIRAAWDSGLRRGDLWRL